VLKGETSEVHVSTYKYKQNENSFVSLQHPHTVISLAGVSEAIAENIAPTMLIGA